MIIKVGYEMHAVACKATAMSWVRHAVQLLHGVDHGTAAAGAYSCAAAWEDKHLTITAVQSLAVVTAVASQDILSALYRCACSTCYMFYSLLEKH
jgi:hypothetical protein